MSRSINWLPEHILKENVEFSRKMYEFIEIDFDTCLEYIALDKKHYDVYSFKLADLILRIGPEILRVFDLILFDQRITRFFKEQPQLELQIVGIQEKKEKRKDGFKDYFTALPELKSKSVEVTILKEKICPFEEISWWESGYNALRHRAIREFKKSATLKHALYSLAGLWVLHDRLDMDLGRRDVARSRVFRPETRTYVSR